LQALPLDIHVQHTLQAYLVEQIVLAVTVKSQQDVLASQDVVVVAEAVNNRRAFSDAYAVTPTKTFVFNVHAVAQVRPSHVRRAVMDILLLSIKKNGY
jgi:hypothetical protein